MGTRAQWKNVISMYHPSTMVHSWVLVHSCHLKGVMLFWNVLIIYSLTHDLHMWSYHPWLKLRFFFLIYPRSLVGYTCCHLEVMLASNMKFCNIQLAICCKCKTDYHIQEKIMKTYNFLNQKFVKYGRLNTLFFCKNIGNPFNIHVCALVIISRFVYKMWWQ